MTIPETPTTKRRTRTLLFAGIGVFAGAVLLLPPAVAEAWGWRRYEPPQNAEEVRERLGYGADHILGMADASEDQERAFGAVLDQIAPRVFEHGKTARALRAELVTALSRESIDRAEIEAIRRRGLALAEEASKMGVDAVVDAGNVLTVEQRVDLVETWQRWHR